MTTDPTTGMSDAHLRNLGAVTYWSGQAEAGVSSVATLLAGSEVAHIIMRGRSVSELVDLCRRLIVEPSRFAAERQGLEDALASVSRAISMRNALLHGFWDSAEVPAGSPISLTFTRRSGEFRRSNLTAEELRRAAQAMADATLDIYSSLFNLQAMESGHPPTERGSFTIDWPEGF